MGKITGFLEIERYDRKYTPVADRLKHFKEFVVPLSEKETRDQAARCMTKQPKSVPPSMLATEMIEVLNTSKITTLLVTEAGKVAGIVHLHDLLRAGVA